MFRTDFPIAELKPAAYNPRRIDDAAFVALRESVRTLGMIRPIIVTTAGKLIAGHQRSRAMLAEGLSVTPAHVLADVGVDDEVRFNQLHNASDKEVVDADLRVDGPLPPGWSTLEPGRLLVARRPQLASKLVEVIKLLAHHGPYSGAVASADGRIVAGHLYAFACRTVGLPIHLYTLPAGRCADAAERLARDYGEFSYDHLPRTTWVQSLAQMYRIRKGRDARGCSRTYETMVLPRLTRGMRLLDFGAGQMDYVRHLRRRRFDAIGVEFYRRKPGTMALDLPAVHRDIDRLCSSLRTGGLFDVVVCDSVLNSVDSAGAERDVLTTINALCRPGGTIVFSGRRRAFIEKIEHRLRRCRTSLTRFVYFVDADGVTAMYQRGVWLFQKFHTDARVHELAAEVVGPGCAVRTLQSGWGVAGEKTVTMPDAEASIRREFDLPLPDGSRIGRGEDVAAAWQSAVALSAGQE